MKKINKILNSIALIVFLMSNFLTPISYAIDDLEVVAEPSQTSEADSESQVVTDVSEGGGSLLMI